MMNSNITNSIIFAFLGIAIFVLVFVILELITPKHNLWKEIVEKQNSALAIVVAAFMLAIGFIIAFAIH